MSRSVLIGKTRFSNSIDASRGLVAVPRHSHTVAAYSRYVVLLILNPLESGSTCQLKVCGTNDVAFYPRSPNSVTCVVIAQVTTELDGRSRRPRKRMSPPVASG